MTQLSKPVSLTIPAGFSVRQQIDQASAFCIAEEAKDHCEHLVGLDAAGNELMVLQGTEGNVIIPKDKWGLLEQTAYVIHNHPSNNTLSLQDLMMVTGNQLQIWAVTKTGDKYFSDGFIAKEDRFLETYNKVQGAVYTDMMLASIFDDGVNEIELNFIVGHATNLICRSKGFLDYHYELTDASKAMYAKFSAQLNRAVGFDLEAGPAVEKKAA